jgi:hypothetical protein
MDGGKKVRKEDRSYPFIKGICVITEISSAQGDKNSASSAQKNSHSWHKD